MTPPPLEVADIIRAHHQEFLQHYGSQLSPQQKRTLTDLAQCRTAALGGHLERCDQCGHERAAYNSCRNRHCPKCQGAARRQWLADRQAELLPVPYFHVVFTLPHQLGPLALQNPRPLYGLLFRVAAATLQQVAASPQHLGAQIGVLAVLHTWGQNLMHHPHLHCVVPGGGLSPDGDRWIACKISRKTNQPFFLPVRVLSRVFRGKFLAGLRRLYERGELSFFGQMKDHASPEAFERLLSSSACKEWVVYAKRPFAGPQQVLRYLSRYTHRVAITNHRLQSHDGQQVEFGYRDYAQQGEEKTMRLTALEFLRRFLLHVLPLRFMRIRQYGFLSSRHRTANLARCRRFLEGAAACSIPQALSDDRGEPIDPWCCPACGSGRMITVGVLAVGELASPGKSLCAFSTPVELSRPPPEVNHVGL